MIDDLQGPRFRLDVCSLFPHRLEALEALQVAHADDLRSFDLGVELKAVAVDVDTALQSPGLHAIVDRQEPGQCSAARTETLHHTFPP